MLAARALAVELGDARRVARCDHSLAESARRLVGSTRRRSLLASRPRRASLIGDEAGVADVLQVIGHGQRPAREPRRRAGELRVEPRASASGSATRPVSPRSRTTSGSSRSSRAISSARRGHWRTEALALYRELGDRRQIGSCEINLGWMDEQRRRARSQRSARRGGDPSRHSRSATASTCAIAENNLGDALATSAGSTRPDGLRRRGRGLPRPRERPGSADGPVRGRRGTPRRAAGPACRRLPLLGAADALRAALGSLRPARGEAVARRNGSRPSRTTIGDAAADDARREGAGFRSPRPIAVASGARGRVTQPRP